MAKVVDPVGTEPPPAVASSWDRASLFARMFFTFVDPMMKMGSKNVLEHNDLEPVPAKEQARILVDSLQRAWAKQAKTPNPSLWRALYESSRFEFWESGFFGFAESVTRITQPLLLGYLLRWLAKPSREVGEGLGWAVGLMLVALVQIIVHHRLYYLTMMNGAKARIAISGVINRKLLKLNACSLMQTSSGNLINLVSNDVQRFDMFYPRFHFSWTAPFDIVVLTILVYLRVGLMPTVYSLLFLFVMLPLLLGTGKLVGNLRRLTAQWTDQRMKMTSEVFAGIASVKAYCWEVPFQEKVTSLRQNERRTIMVAMATRAINHGLSFATPTICILIVIIAFWWSGETLTIEIVFSTMALIHVLTVSIGKNLGIFFDTYFEFKTSVSRMRRFLMMEEFNADFQSKLFDSNLPENGADILAVQDACFKWSKGEPGNALSGINLTASSTELVLIHGPTGSGKSALLQALLGELSLVEGQLRIGAKRVAYAAQKSWILAGTVRSNIVWGSNERSFDEEWYNRVLDACSLTTDLEQFPLGDATEIGEKGVNLSGGQKARVGLARAVYSRAPLYLLDDPLAACDPKVANEIYEKCILGLLGEHCVLLATHNEKIDLCSKRKVVRLSGGRIERIETFEAAEVEGGGTDSAQEDTVGAVTVPRGDPKAGTQNALVPDEERVKGKIKNNTLLRYAQAGGIGRVALVALCLVSSQACAFGAELVLKLWTEQSPDEQQRGALLTPFVALALVATVLGLLRGFIFYSVSLRASTKLHNSAFERVLRSPLSFFVQNPLGRILNKFSADLGQADETLPSNFFRCLENVMLCLGSVILSMTAIPYLLVIMVPIFVYLYRLRKYFVSTSRELMRLQAVSKSPVFVTFSNTVSGLLTVRAYGKSGSRQAEFVELLNENFKTWYAWLLANRWVGTRLDFVSFLILVAVTLFGVLFADSVDPGMLGFAITYCIQLSGVFQYMVRLTAKVESQLTCVERILHYSQLPSEEEVESTATNKAARNPMQATATDSRWPSKGAIEFKAVSVRYRKDTPDVLRNLSFSIPGGSKIGVVGRTGSGKSSLTLALCRLNIVSSGTIAIDNVDCSQVSMGTLRRNLSFVPQEAVMFAGSLRFNIDPFDAVSDTKLWEALRKVRLYDFIFGHPEKLAMTIHEGGENLSVGQRQCISLARAILHSGKIYVMDEATASVDSEMDSLIQSMIRDKEGSFAGSTVITIAHRLETVMDSDMILVLDDGELVEYGTPTDLLGGAGKGFFKSLAEEGKLQD
jgi:ATP-binding cassette, subfamily C (CFTR/MRP), member 4